jgi:hypothetical protein
LSRLLTASTIVEWTAHAPRSIGAGGSLNKWENAIINQLYTNYTPIICQLYTNHTPINPPKKPPQLRRRRGQLLLL